MLHLTSKLLHPDLIDTAEEDCSTTHKPFLDYS